MGYPYSASKRMKEKINANFNSHIRYECKKKFYVKYFLLGFNNKNYFSYQRKRSYRKRHLMITGRAVLVPLKNGKTGILES